MIDEVARIDDGSGSLNSALSMINKAMLNASFKSSDRNPIHSALILSSLVIPPSHGTTDSSRIIRTLQLPPKLNVDDVLSKWWLPQLLLLSSKDDESKIKLPSLSDWDIFKLKLLATTINNLPRALEKAGLSLRDRLQCKDGIDDDLISSVFESLKKMLHRYATSVTGNMWPVLFGQNTPKYLYHLVYRGNPIKLDPSIMLLLRSSVYTNSLKNISASEWILPEGSILMIIALAGCANEDVVGGISLLPSSCFMNTYRSMQDVLKKSIHRQDGDALESAGIHWLQTRIAVAKSYGKTSIKLSELFAIDPENDPEILLPARSSYWNDDKMTLPPLYRNKEDSFMTKFDAIQKSRFTMLKSCPGQRWDSMIITSRIYPNSKKRRKTPFVIFIEFKSWQTRALSTRQQNLDQYNAVMKLHKFLNSEDCTGCYDSPQSQALKDGQFIYIYLTTYPNIDKSTTHPKQLYITDETEAERFFGILFPFYQAVRSAIDSQQNLS